MPDLPVRYQCIRDRPRDRLQVLPRIPRWCDRARMTYVARWPLCRQATRVAPMVSR